MTKYPSSLTNKKYNTEMSALEKRDFKKFMDGLRHASKKTNLREYLIDITGEWLEFLGYKITYETIFSSGSFENTEKKIDILAEKQEKLIIAQIKDEITIEDLNDIYEYTRLIDEHNIKADFYLSTSFVNYYKLIALGEKTKDMIMLHNMKIMFVDEKLLFLCSTYDQLVGNVMPEFVSH